MPSIWSKIILTTLVAALAACGSDSKKRVLNEGPVEVVFPIGQSTTTSDTVIVKGTITSGVNALTVNETEADFTQSDAFWFAEIPVTSESATTLSIAYEDQSAIYDVSTGISIEQSTIYLQYFDYADAVEFGDTLYVDDSSSKNIFAMNTDGSDIRNLWHYGDTSFDGFDRFEIERNMRISEDGSLLFVVISGEVGADDTNVAQILSIDTATADVSVLYGPNSNGYTLFDYGHMAYLPNMGEAGQLVIAGSGTNDIPSIFDIGSNSISAMNIDALNDLTGGLVYTRIYHLSEKSDSVLRVIGATRPDNTWHFWSGELDLAGCEGEAASCRLTTAALMVESDFTGCDSPIDNSGLHNGVFHENSQRWIYSSSRESYAELCSLNLSDHSLTSSNINTDSGEYRNQISYTKSKAFLTLSGNAILSADLPSSFDGSALTFGEFNNVPTMGDASIALQSAREVRVNDSQQHAYWMDRDLGKVHKLDLTNWQWETLTSIDDEVLAEGQEASRPNFRPEESALDETNGILYLVSDSQESLFAIDINTGEYEIALAYDETGENLFNLYDIDAIAFDEERSLLYIANKRKWDATREDETEFNLLAYNTTSKELTEISPSVIIADNPLQEDMEASYDMVFDQSRDQVLFYSSESDVNYAIWSIDVTNGERSIVSFEYDSSWTPEECLADMNAELCEKTALIDQPRTSNARGHAMDNLNNRLLMTSQSSAAVLSMDAVTGVVTNISPEDYRYGPVFTSPKGIDLIGSTNVALVSDESIEGLFLVDIDTGQRVLVMNQ